MSTPFKMKGWGGWTNSPMKKTTSSPAKDRWDEMHAKAGEKDPRYAQMTKEEYKKEALAQSKHKEDYGTYGAMGEGHRKKLAKVRKEKQAKTQEKVDKWNRTVKETERKRLESAKQDAPQVSKKDLKKAKKQSVKSSRTEQRKAIKAVSADKESRTWRERMQEKSRIRKEGRAERKKLRNDYKEAKKSLKKDSPAKKTKSQIKDYKKEYRKGTTAPEKAKATKPKAKATKSYISEHKKLEKKTNPAEAIGVKKTKVEKKTYLTEAQAKKEKKRRKVYTGARPGGKLVQQAAMKKAGIKKTKDQKKQTKEKARVV